MTAKHADPEYRKNARIIRAQVRRAHAAGQEVQCGRCPWPIDPEQAFDVGHIDPNGGHSLANLRPEHRGENRRAGGKAGALKQTLTKQLTGRMLPW